MCLCQKENEKQRETERAVAEFMYNKKMEREWICVSVHYSCSVISRKANFCLRHCKLKDVFLLFLDAIYGLCHNDIWIFSWTYYSVKSTEYDFEHTICTNIHLC